MSIEKHLSDLTAAVTALTAALNQRAGATTVPQAMTQMGAAIGAGAQLAQNPAVVQPQMPTLPTFAAPVVQSAPNPGAPFADGPGLIAYVMDAYKTMGPTKGAGIQGVLTSIGVANINDVKPEQYGTLYAGVEALKRS